MELRRYFAMLRRRLVIVVLTIAAGLAAGYVNTPRTATYSAASSRDTSTRPWQVQRFRNIAVKEIP